MWPPSGGNAELLADAKIVVEYGHSTSVEFFVASTLTLWQRRKCVGGRNALFVKSAVF